MISEHPTREIPEAIPNPRDPEEDCNESLSYEEFYIRLNINPPEVKTLGKKVASFLEGIIEENENTQSEVSPFDIQKVPKISLAGYVQRIVDYGMNSAESWIIALCLIERYVELRETICIHRLNVNK